MIIYTTHFHRVSNAKTLSFYFARKFQSFTLATSKVYNMPKKSAMQLMLLEQWFTATYESFLVHISLANSHVTTDMHANFKWFLQFTHEVLVGKHPFSNWKLLALLVLIPPLENNYAHDRLETRIFFLFRKDLVPFIPFFTLLKK